MKAAVLIRAGSFSTRSHLVIGSPSDRDPGAGFSFLRRSRSTTLSPRSALQVNPSKETPPNLLRRARSEADLILSDRPSRISSFPARVAEEEEKEGKDLGVLDLGISEVEYSGGGMGKGREIGGGKGGGSDRNENNRIGEYYREMLSVDPGNPLLLRNYGRFLHEVEGDVERAEEYYGRAILASPGDGEVLSLYGKLVWETHRDEGRAESYFERAVEASPSDCYVLGSYAKFLWDAEEEEGEGEESVAGGEGRGENSLSSSSTPLVEAF